MATAQRRNALDTNSVPLPERRCRVALRAGTNRNSTAIALPKQMLPATPMARLPRVSPSAMIRRFICCPLAQALFTKPRTDLISEGRRARPGPGVRNTFARTLPRCLESWRAPKLTRFVRPQLVSFALHEHRYHAKAATVILGRKLSLQRHKRRNLELHA